MENEKPVDIEEINEVAFGFENEKKVLQLSKNQLKKLGLTYKKEPTEKEKVRNDKLREMQKERHAKFKQDKDIFEKKQLEELTQKLTIKDKPKQKYVKKMTTPPSSESEDEDYKEFLKFKKAKAKAVVKKPVDPDSDDDRIQKKKNKAKEIIDTVEKIDKKINQIYKNPYLDLFTKK